MPDKPNPYEEAAAVLLRESGCTVRKYRTSMTGVAHTKAKDWGISVPRPRGPISFGVFAHEVGHQMLHRGNGSYPRWLKEVEAWEYALAQFERFDLPGVEKSRNDAAKSLVYAAHKANRRATPETAQAILDRYPEWVWAGDSARALAGLELDEKVLRGEISDLEAEVVRLQQRLEREQRAADVESDMLTEQRNEARRMVVRLREALQKIAGPSPRSHRKAVDQLTDAVKWRQGVARDALAVASPDKPPEADEMERAAREGRIVT